MEFDATKLISKAGKAYLAEEVEVWAAIRERSGYPSDGEELDRLCTRWLDIGKKLLLDGRPIEAVKARLLAMADLADARAKAGIAEHYHPGAVELDREMIAQVIKHMGAVELKVVSQASEVAASEAARVAAAKEEERRTMLRRALG
jgi:hypothetical protein